MPTVLPFEQIQTYYDGDDFLEPGEKGLVIATRTDHFPSKRRSKLPVTPRFEGKLYMWIVGKPRRVYAQATGLWGLVNHSGALMSSTFGTLLEIGDGKTPKNIFVKDLTSGNVVFHSEDFHLEEICSGGGNLFGTVDEYIPEVHDPHNEIYERAYHKTTINKVTGPDSLEKLETRESKITAMIYGPDGLVVLEKPRHKSGDSPPSRIVNISSGKVIRNVPKKNHDRLICSLAYSDGKIIFPTPDGILNQDLAVVAKFPYVPWLLSELERIQMTIDSPKARLEESRKLEMVAGKHLDYSYAKAMQRWSGRSDPNDDLYVRIALHRHLEDNFQVNQIQVYEGHLMMASNSILYAVPIPEDGKTVTIDPRNARVWRFRDNVIGMAVVEGDQVKNLKGSANLKFGRRRGSVSFRAVA